jgi:hypothetical protein
MNIYNNPVAVVCATGKVGRFSAATVTGRLLVEHARAGCSRTPSLLAIFEYINACVLLLMGRSYNKEADASGIDYQFSTTPIYFANKKAGSFGLPAYAGL